MNPAAPVGPRDIKPTPTGQIVLDAALGRTPAYIDTGLNVVHVDDVAAGHVLAFHRGRPGERYILAGRNFTLKRLFADLARIARVPPPPIKLPGGVATAGGRAAELTGLPLPVIGDEVRSATMWGAYRNTKDRRELGFAARPHGATH